MKTVSSYIKTIGNKLIEISDKALLGSEDRFKKENFTNKGGYKNSLSINKKDWENIPLNYKRVNLNLLSFVKESKEKELKVLDVGCGLGMTLLEFKNRYKNANLYGIELNKEIGEIAQTNANVIIGNVEEANLDFPEEYFDYIILGGVLEHLIKPQETLIKLKKHLKKGGYMLISIPNVMYNGVIKNLIYGNWTYEDSGILNQAHLRFFTYRESLKMFKQADLKVVNCITIRAEGDNEFVKKLVNITAHHFKWEYNTFQYLFKVQC